MNKIVNFDSYDEFVLYRKSKTIRELGAGSEGSCYLGSDGLAYKDLTNGFSKRDYILENVITSSECDNKSFAFPHVLFAVNDELVGYTTNVVKKDITNEKYLSTYGIDHIDFDKLYSAYQVLYQDSIKLAEKGISIIDLSFNLMFDGEKFTAVDTCEYFYTSGECIKHNTESVDDAVKNLFTIYALFNFDEELDTSLDVKEFLQMVKTKYSSSDTNGKPYLKK